MISVLVPSPSALIETEDVKTLVIADLHIGWELALSKKGIHVTAQMPTILNKLKKVVSEYNPDKLLILGDVKHTVAAAKTGEWKHVPEFFNELNKEVKIIRVVRGNHDGNLTPLLPGNIKVLPSTGIKEGKVVTKVNKRLKPKLGEDSPQNKDELKVEILSIDRSEGVVIQHQPE